MRRCSVASASCSPSTMRASTPPTSARTTRRSPAPASVASRGSSCFATPRRPPAAPKGTISVGATIHDSLARRDVLLTAESTYAQEWRLAGTTGQIVTIDLASEAFDAFVFLLGPGLERPLQDDDSGGRCN